MYSKLVQKARELTLTGRRGQESPKIKLFKTWQLIYLTCKATVSNKKKLASALKISDSWGKWR